MQVIMDPVPEPELPAMVGYTPEVSIASVYRMVSYSHIANWLS